MVEVTGEIDRDTAEQLRRTVLDAVATGPPRSRCDLDGRRDGSTAGAIAALLAGRDAAHRTGVRLRLARVHPAVRRSLAIAGRPVPLPAD